MLQYRQRMLHAIQAHKAKRTTPSTRGALDTLACSRRRLTKRLYQEKTINSEKEIVLHVAIDLSSSMCGLPWHSAWKCLMEIWHSYKDVATIYLYVWGEACSEYTGEAIEALAQRWEDVARLKGERQASRELDSMLSEKMEAILCHRDEGGTISYHYFHDGIAPDHALIGPSPSKSYLTNGTSFEFVSTALLLRVRAEPEAKHLAFFLTDGASSCYMNNKAPRDTMMTYNGTRVPYAPLSYLPSLMQEHSRRHDFHLFPVGLLDDRRDDLKAWREDLNRTLGTKTARAFHLEDDNSVIRTFYQTVLPEIEKTRP